MPVTQAQLDAAAASVAALNAAIDDGVRQVTLPGGQVTIYNTTESLQKARDDAARRHAALQAQYAVENGATPTVAPRHYYYTYGGRGY
jgi:hypothetical protein